MDAVNLTGVATDESKDYDSLVELDQMLMMVIVGLVGVLVIAACIVGMWIHQKNEKMRATMLALEDRFNRNDPNGPSLNANTDTEFEALLDRLEDLLVIVASPCSNPLSWRRARSEIDGLILRIRTTPLEQLVCVDALRDMRKSISVPRGEEQLSVAVDMSVGNVVDMKVFGFLENMLSKSPNQLKDKAVYAMRGTPNAKCAFDETESTELERASFSAASMSVAFEPDPALPDISLEKICNWKTWDIFDVASQMPPGELFPKLFLSIADRGLDVMGPLGLSRSTFTRALSVAQSFYENPFDGPCNPYHTAVHGADVMCTSVAMLMKLPPELVGRTIPPLTYFTVIIAALMHDFRHPGVPSRFLCAIHHDLSLTYSDDSVVERMHTAESFKLLRSHGCFKTLTLDDYAIFRKAYIEMILATDLAGNGLKSVVAVKAAFPNYDRTAQAEAADPSTTRRASLQMLGSAGRRMSASMSSRRYSTNTNISESRPSARISPDAEGPSLTIEEQKDIATIQPLLNLVIECADLSHPLKPRKIHQRWSSLVAQEFFQQGNLETKMNLPISPLCDQSTAGDAISFGKGQQGFIDYVVAPKIRLLSKICRQDSTWITQLEENHEYWQFSRSFNELTTELENNPVFRAGPTATRAPKPNYRIANGTSTTPVVAAMTDQDEPSTKRSFFSKHGGRRPKAGGATPTSRRTDLTINTDPSPAGSSQSDNSPATR